MPTIPAFVDTNVLLYAASTHPAEADKRNAAGKLKPPLSGEDALKFLQEILPGEIVGLDFVLFQEAVRLRERFQISYWDAAILAAAKRLGGTTLYSGDF